jgi:hypothetical protein
MTLRLIVLLTVVSSLTTVALAQSGSPAPTVAQLVGTWKLVSITDTVAGKAQDSEFGAHPQGFLMYEPDRHMCAVLANGDRPAWKDKAKATDAEKIAYYDTLIAYCGSYNLDSAASVVTHYPTVAWSPDYVGSTQPRPFRLEGNKLIITVSKGLTNPRAEKRVLVWQRAADGQ